MISSLATVGWMSEQTWPFYMALAGTAAQLTWQVSTVRVDDREDCWQKFRSNQWLGASLFLGIVTSNFLRPKKGAKNEDNENTVETS
uniref:Uncharacterized protein n=1 Tax=Ditylenchus dipsaci TaxID=166011 RepID=A0A915D3K6_9BILA